MPRPKSILKRISVDTALRAHNCQHVKTHRVQQGEKRLKLAVNRSHEHYCVQCALQIINSDIEKLQKIRDQLLGQ